MYLKNVKGNRFMELPMIIADGEHVKISQYKVIIFLNLSR
jgi:hypothetical protein